MVNSVGKRLQQARIAKQLSVEEAARVTRIRPDKLIDLEEDNYSNFPSMSYAKGFLLLYARFLGVDVRDFADSLQAPNPVSTDDYEYLNAGSSAAPPTTRRPYHFTPRRQHSILPVLVVCVLVGAVAFGIYLVVTFQRLGPLEESVSEKNASPSATPAISTLPSPVPATPAIPVATPALRSTPPTLVATTPPAGVAPAVAVTHLPSPPPVPSPAPAATFDPTKEVRRAEPVAVPAPPPQTSAPTTPQTPPAPVGTGPDLSVIAPATPADSPAALKEVAIRPVRKTWVTIHKDMQDSPPYFQDWLYPGDPPLKLSGRKFWIQVQDPSSIVVTQDGQPLPASQSDIQIE